MPGVPGEVLFVALYLFILFLVCNKRGFTRHTRHKARCYWLSTRHTYPAHPSAYPAHPAHLHMSKAPCTLSSAGVRNLMPLNTGTSLFSFPSLDLL